MESGTPPYDYGIGTPLLGIYPHSGVFFENAMFVLNAERRRYLGNLENGDFEWNLYTSIYGEKRGFEPTGNNQWMNNEIPSIVLNYILELRKNFFEHIRDDGIVEDSDYLPEFHRRDWIHNAYPGNPNGRNEVDNPSGEGNYFRLAPTSPGFQLGTDIGVLGNSGVLFDIDVGEVMYNPMPRLRRTLFGEAHTLSHQGLDQFLYVLEDSIQEEQGIPIPISPVFPAFQTTEGDIVNTTDRDIKHGVSRYFHIGPIEVRSQYPFDSLHVGSGYVRLDGDLLRSDSTYYIGTGGTNAAEDFSIVDSFLFQASGARSIGIPKHLNFDFGTKMPSGQNTNIGRVFLSPPGSNMTPIESGIYHIAVDNSNVKFNTVASGVTSHWPSGNAYRACPGYHVFNDCIWIRDQGPNVNASGLAVISPYDGTAMWLRNAELTDISLEGNLKVSQSLLSFPRLNYPGLIGMTRKDNLIHMVYPVLSAFTIDSTVTENTNIGEDNVKLYVGRFDDTLNLDSTLESSVQVSDSSNTFPNPMGDIMYDGSFFWICSRDGTEVAQYTDTLNLSNGYTRTGSDICRRIAKIGLKLFAYGQDSAGSSNVGGLQRVTFSAGNFLLDAPKIIDASSIDPLPGNDAVIVNTVHHVINTDPGNIHLSGGERS